MHQFFHYGIVVQIVQLHDLPFLLVQESTQFAMTPLKVSCQIQLSVSQLGTG